MRSADGVSYRVADLVALPEPEWIPWLERKGASYGYDLLDAHVKGAATIQPTRGRGEPVQTQLAVDFAGRLRVVNPEQFLTAVIGGIGRGKGYGLGLLMLRAN